MNEEFASRLYHADRKTLERVLESVSIQCYEHETDTTLIEAILVNLDDGTLEEPDVWAMLEGHMTPPETINVRDKHGGRDAETDLLSSCE